MYHPEPAIGWFAAILGNARWFVILVAGCVIAMWLIGLFAKDMIIGAFGAG